MDVQGFGQSAHCSRRARQYSAGGRGGVETSMFKYAPLILEEHLFAFAPLLVPVASWPWCLSQRTQ